MCSSKNIEEGKQNGCNTCARSCQEDCTENSMWVPEAVDGHKVRLPKKARIIKNCETCRHPLSDLAACGALECSGWSLWTDGSPAAGSEGLLTGSEALINSACLNLSNFLIEKNHAYGDSAINPSRIFSKADAVEQIKVRIDDKLNRMIQGKEYPGDDTVKDLAGYLILLMVAKEVHSE